MNLISELNKMSLIIDKLKEEYAGDYPWVVEAKKWLGLKELTGKNDHPLLDAGWRKFDLGWLIGQPWCGLGLMYVFDKVGIEPAIKGYRAKEWLNWGVALDKPMLGAVGILGRKGGGHVIIILGITKDGMIVGIGGNQSNEASIRAFHPDRFVGFRAPAGWKLDKEPPLMTASGELSTNEA